MFVPDPKQIVSSMPRRQFFAAGAAAGAGLSLARLAGAQPPATGEERSILAQNVPADPQPLPEPAAMKKPSEPIITAGATVLFQGDSITDAGRNRATNITSQYQGWGAGYAFLAATEMMMANPDYALQIYNRGISGNKVPQLVERWQADCLDLKPDVLSILVGVNDLWHRFTGGYTGTPESYYEQYRELIQRTKTELPKVKLVICEPFVLKVGAVDDKFFPAINEYQDAAEAIAIEFADAWVPYQKVFRRRLAGRASRDLAPGRCSPVATGRGADGARMAEFHRGLCPGGHAEWPDDDRGAQGRRAGAVPRAARADPCARTGPEPIDKAGRSAGRRRTTGHEVGPHPFDNPPPAEIAGRGPQTRGKPSPKRT